MNRLPGALRFSMPLDICLNSQFLDFHKLIIDSLSLGYTFTKYSKVFRAVDMRATVSHEYNWLVVNDYYDSESIWLGNKLIPVGSSITYPLDTLNGDDFTDFWCKRALSEYA